MAVCRTRTSGCTSDVWQEETSSLYTAATGKLSRAEQWFSVEDALWDPKPHVATVDTQGKVKLYLGTVVSPGTCQPRLVISLKNAVSCHARSEEEASTCGCWILWFPAALHIFPLFLRPPCARTHRRAAPCWAGSATGWHQRAAAGRQSWRLQPRCLLQFPHPEHAKTFRALCPRLLTGLRSWGHLSVGLLAGCVSEVQECQDKTS